MQAELAGMEVSADIDVLLTHKEEIGQKRQELSEYQNRITEQQGIIEKAREHTDAVAPLISQREELLADIALGEDRAADLSALDKQITATEKAQEKTLAEKKQAIKQAEQTIAGLERRMQAIQSDIYRLENLEPVLLDLFVMGAAEQAAAEFLTLAEGITDKFTELLALDRWIAEIGQRKTHGLFLDEYARLTIPRLKASLTPGNHEAMAVLGENMVDTSEALVKIKQDLMNNSINL